MDRATETDEFGNVIKFDLPEIKRCPICRKEATETDIEHIESTVKGNDNF